MVYIKDIHVQLHLTYYNTKSSTLNYMDVSPTHRTLSATILPPLNTYTLLQWGHRASCLQPTVLNWKKNSQFYSPIYSNYFIKYFNLCYVTIFFSISNSKSFIYHKQKKICAALFKEIWSINKCLKLCFDTFNFLVRCIIKLIENKTRKEMRVSFFLIE